MRRPVCQVPRVQRRPPITYVKELSLNARSPAEWEAVSLSEEHMVAALVKARQRLDPVQMGTPCDYRLQETMLCLYVGLDSLIARAPLTERERMILRGYMAGYATEETGEAAGVTRQAVSKAFHAAVRKLVAQNNKDWLDMASDRFIVTKEALPYARRYHAKE